MTRLEHPWLRQYAAHLWSEARPKPTVEAYLSDLAIFEQYLHASSLPLSSLTAEHVRGWLGRLEIEGSAPASRARKLTSLRLFCVWAVAQGLMPSNSTHGVSAPRLRKAALPPDSILPQVERVVESIPSKHPRQQRDRAFFAFLLDTGLHVSEALTLSLETLDLDQRCVLVKQQCVYFSETTRILLADYLTSVRPLWVPKSGSPYVFLSVRRTKLSRQAVWKVWARYVAAAGMPDTMTVDLLRRAFQVRQVLARYRPTITLPGPRTA